jgi:hypothetical protein
MDTIAVLSFPFRIWRIGEDIERQGCHPNPSAERRDDAEGHKDIER